MIQDHTHCTNCRLSTSRFAVGAAIEIRLCPLHAAAHDLLAALEGCLGYFQGMTEQTTIKPTSGSFYAPDSQWLAPIRAAIAKATGPQAR